MTNVSFTTIDEYIATLDENDAELATKIRACILEYAPDATQKIAWAMPSFVQNGYLIHFFIHKNHVGIYPGDGGIRAFSKEFEEKGYKYSKGAVQFLKNKDFPWDLLKRIVLNRVEANTLVTK